MSQLIKGSSATKNLIHLNNASAALLPSCVLETMTDYLYLEQTVGGSQAQLQMANQFREFYQQAAKLLHCKADEIAYMPSASTAWHTLLQAIPWQLNDKVLITNAEYRSLYCALIQLKKRYSLSIDILHLENDSFDLDLLKNKLTHETRLVSISHLPSHGGLPAPVEAIGQLLKEYPCYYALDAAQSLGQIPIDVNRIQCDFLIATGRKYLRGPRGTGLLYVRKQQQDKLTPYFANASCMTVNTAGNSVTWNENMQAYETWERNYAAFLGLSSAIAYANELGLEYIWQRVQQLAKYAIKALSDINFINVITPVTCPSGILVCNSALDIQKLGQMLQKRSPAIHIGCWQVDSSPLMHFPNKYLMRISLHYYNTENDIDQMIAALLEEKSYAR